MTRSTKKTKVWSPLSPFERTDREARRLIEMETDARAEKTARLRAARLESEAGGPDRKRPAE
ncbi:hypothetical protein [Pseudoroseicyclus sp. CXY001]|uniref:hypothetical protein n=1 Tax=Pseudoroseicyclus sp. CXY001 TaxID=3242492 RepID=UPI003571732E